MNKSNFNEVYDTNPYDEKPPIENLSESEHGNYQRIAQELKTISIDLETFLYFAKQQHGKKNTPSENKEKRNFDLRMKRVVIQALDDTTLNDLTKNQIVERAIDLSKSVDIEIHLKDDSKLDPKLHEELQVAAAPLILQLRTLVLAYTIAYKVNKKFANECDIMFPKLEATTKYIRLFSPKFRVYFREIKPGIIKDLAEKLLESNDVSSVRELCKNRTGLEPESTERFVEEQVNLMLSKLDSTYSSTASKFKAQKISLN